MVKGLVFLFLFSFSLFADTNPDSKVIYGVDNRKDIYEVNDLSYMKLARSTVALIHTSSLVESEKTWNIPSATLGEQSNYCPTEKFTDQPAAAFCSGFLLKDDLIVTAGHCVTTEQECLDTAFVFDLGYQWGDYLNLDFPKDKVFFCKELVGQDYTYWGTDYAVIRLTEKPENREPLAYRKTGSIKKKAGVTIIGHPIGLPTKISDGAFVRAAKSNLPYFSANIDSYGGNSGSAVFNSKTKKVEGILVRGAADFIFDYEKGCRKSNVCSMSECRGEDVTKISEVLKFLQESDPNEG